MLGLGRALGETIAVTLIISPLFDPHVAHARAPDRRQLDRVADRAAVLGVERVRHQRADGRRPDAVRDHADRERARRRSSWPARAPARRRRSDAGRLADEFVEPRERDRRGRRPSTARARIRPRGVADRPTSLDLVGARVRVVLPHLAGLRAAHAALGRPRLLRHVVRDCSSRWCGSSRASGSGSCDARDQLVGVVVATVGDRDADPARGDRRLHDLARVPRAAAAVLHART